MEFEGKFVARILVRRALVRFGCLARGPIAGRAAGLPDSTTAPLELTGFGRQGCRGAAVACP